MVQLYSRVSRSLALPISTIPRFIIPLADKLNSSIGGMPETFTRNSTAAYVDDAGIEHTVGIDAPLFRNGRYLPQTSATNIFLQSGNPATQTITVVSGSTYTVSCYGSGSIALSGAGTGTVVQGTPVAFTAASTTLTCVPTSVNKAQVELGSQATSYIPTTTAPMTRVADVLRYDVGSVITQGQGSLYCEFYYHGFSAVQEVVLTLSNGIDPANRLFVYVGVDGKIAFQGASGGVYSLILLGNSPVTGVNKVLFTYATGAVKLFFNGSFVGTITTLTISSSLNRLNVGCFQSGTKQLNNAIGNVKYFKEVLTPAEAIKLTTV